MFAWYWCVTINVVDLLGDRFHGLLDWMLRSVHWQTTRQVQSPQPRRSLSRSRVSVSQWASRCLSVDNGSNGMWRGGVESWPVCYNSIPSGSMSGEFTLLPYTYSIFLQVPELHQAINKRVANLHIVAGRLRSHINYFPTGYTADFLTKHRHANMTVKIARVRSGQLMATQTGSDGPSSRCSSSTN